MKIALEDRNPASIPAYFVGPRKRLATSTGVRFVGGDRLVCASLVGQRLYLVAFDLTAGRAAVLDHVDCTFGGEPSSVDLVDFDGRDRVVTGNCEHRSASLYRIDGDRLRHAGDVRIQAPQIGYVHAASFVPGTDLVCAASQSGDRRFHLARASDGAVVASVGDGEWCPKDAAFSGPDRMLALYSRSRATSRPGEPSGVRLASIDLGGLESPPVVERTWDLDVFQGDAVAWRGGDVFLADQVGDAVRHYVLAGDELRAGEDLSGFSFPHGVDLDPARRLLAVTNYGDNTVELRRLGRPGPS